MSKYSVEHKEGEIVIKGAMPASDFGALVDVWSERGFTLLDLERASELRATMVVAPEDGA